MVEQFNLVADDELHEGLLPLSQQLDKVAADPEKKLIVVAESPFASAAASFDVLWEHVFRTRAESVEFRTRCVYPASSAVTPVIPW